MNTQKLEEQKKKTDEKPDEKHRLTEPLRAPVCDRELQGLSTTRQYVVWFSQLMLPDGALEARKRLAADRVQSTFGATLSNPASICDLPLTCPLYQFPWSFALDANDSACLSGGRRPWSRR